MTLILEWVRQRQLTLVLGIFFIVWYALQLATLYLFGEEIARYWFYFEQPPDAISPGMVLAPISHDLYTLTHIGFNLLLLLIAGGLTEPYIGKERIIIHVIGVGYLGILVANSTIIIHHMWIIAGASVGILSLWTYAGLNMRHRAGELMSGGISASAQGIERLGAALLLGAIPLILIQETLLTDQVHSGHTIGVLFGFLYYGIESHFD